MTAAGGCPLPPPGIGTRTLPVIMIDLQARPLYRVHRNSRSAIHFNQPSVTSQRYRSVNDYEGPNLWSAAVHDNVSKPHGIYFTSRFSGEPCVAVFDRIGMTVAGTAVPLLTAPGTDDFLTLHGIDLF